MRLPRSILVPAGAAVLALPLVPAAAHAAHAAPPPPRFANCAALHAHYPHGVAKPGGFDVVRGTSKPAKKFKIALSVYLINRHLDRDRDGVACEKR